MQRILLAGLAVLALNGCAAFTLYVQQHAAGLAAAGLVATTAAQVGGALVSADELERRVERRVEDVEKAPAK